MHWLTILLFVFLNGTQLRGQQTLPVLEFGRGLPQQVLWSPTGDALLVLTRTNDLWRYDVPALTTTAMLPHVREAFFSPEGSWLLTRNEQDRWAVRAADHIERTVHEGFTSVRFSADGLWLLTGDDTGISVRPTHDPRQVRLAGLQDVQFSPDGHHVLTRLPDATYVLRDSALTPVEAQPVFNADVTAVQWRPDGSQIAAFTSGERIDIIDIRDATLMYSLTLPNRARYTSLEWSPVGSHLLDYDYAGNARIWDAATGDLILDLPSGETYFTPEELTQQFRAGPSIWFITLSNDGTHLFRCHNNGGDITLQCGFHDVLTGAQTNSGSGDSPWYRYGFDFSPDRRYFALSGGIYDANTGETVADFSETGAGGYYRAWSADNRHVALVPFWSPDITLFNLEEMQVERSLNFPSYLYSAESVRWSPDGSQLVTWGNTTVNQVPGSGLITLWDAETGLEVGRITDHVLFGYQNAFSTDSVLVAASDAVGNVSIFDTTSGALIHILSGYEGRVNLLQWQPGGHLLAATTGGVVGLGNPDVPAPDGNIVLIWNTETGELVTRLEHTNQVVAMSWHPSGRYLVTDDHTGMGIWDTVTEQQRRVLEMSGGFGVDAPAYSWTAGGDVVTRQYYNCTHGGGPSTDLYNIVTSQHIGPIDCSGDANFEWVTALDGIVVPTSSCPDYPQGQTARDCHIQVSLISTRVPLETFTYQSLYQIEPAYTFGHYELQPRITGSSDNTALIILTEGDVQRWTLGVDSAVLEWTAEDVSHVVWSHTDRRLALTSANYVSIADAETGEILSILPDVQPAEISELIWSIDDASIMIVTSTDVRVFNAATGERLLALQGVQRQEWVNRYLSVCYGEPCVQELWDVDTAHRVASGNRFPTSISPDGRFGAEIWEGVFRIWSLSE